VHFVHAPVVDRDFLARLDVLQGIVGDIAIIGLKVGRLGMIHVPADRDAQEIDWRPIAAGGANPEALKELLVRRGVRLLERHPSAVFR